MNVTPFYHCAHYFYFTLSKNQSIKINPCSAVLLLNQKSTCAELCWKKITCWGHQFVTNFHKIGSTFMSCLCTCTIKPHHPKHDGIWRKIQNNDIMQSFEIQRFIFKNHTKTMVENSNSHCHGTCTYIYKCTDVWHYVQKLNCIMQ